MVQLRDGYVVDLVYATKAYPELSPTSLDTMALMGGVAPPSSDEPSYLELGFGQGLSLNIAAAANPGVYRGVDFIPEHVAWAGRMAAASGADLTVSADSFTEFAAEPGGEDYDYITLHGVWSWADDPARRAIAEILQRRLRPGGLALISYNTPAGWAALEPMRQLFLRYSAASGLAPAAAMKGAISLGLRLGELGGKYFADNPVVMKELEKISAMDPHYLVHEYLNEGHRILSFADTHALLEGAGLDYVGPARFAEYLDRRRLKGGALELIAGLDDPLLEETVRDLMQASRFRSDLYVKRPAPAADEAARRGHLFALVGAPDAPPVVERGKAPGFQVLANEVWEVFAADPDTPVSMEAAIAALPTRDASRIELAFMSLCGVGGIAPYAEPTAKTQEQVAALNRALMSETAEGRLIPTLAAATTGGGVSVGLSPQLLLQAEAAGEADPAQAATDRLLAQERRLVDKGSVIEGAEANLAEMRKRYESLGPIRARLARLGAID